MLFMRGMVNMPVVQTLATEDPEMDPMSPELITATFAGPPVEWPASAIAKSMINFPIPVCSKKVPKRINRKTNVAETSSGVPKTPSVPRYM